MTATKYGRIEVKREVVYVDGIDVAVTNSGSAALLLRSALSDLTASTPTVDGPEGLTGPSAEGTWYGPLRCVPEGWEYRGHEEGEWMVPAGRSSGVIFEARPVPLPVTEEVPRPGDIVSWERHLIRRVVVAVDGPYAWVRDEGDGPERFGSLAPLSELTVQREGDEK